jgi:hypothetical protein
MPIGDNRIPALSLKDDGRNNNSLPFMRESRMTRTEQQRHLANEDEMHVFYTVSFGCVNSRRGVVIAVHRLSLDVFHMTTFELLSPLGTELLV